MRKIEHGEVREALREWKGKGNLIPILKEEVEMACYTVYPKMVGPEAPGLSFRALTGGYSPLVTLSDSSQVDDSDLLDL